MVMLKLLYRIIEAGTHQWATYSKHYKEKLLITTSIFNFCFLIVGNKGKWSLYKAYCRHIWQVAITYGKLPSHAAAALAW